MRRMRRHRCVTVASEWVTCFSRGRSGAQDPDTLLRHTQVLPEWIHEVLARNPTRVGPRTQRDAATNRIIPLRSLNAPTISTPLWHVPQTVNVTQEQHRIIGLSQSFPFSGNLALKGDVASRSANMTERMMRAV